MIIMKVMVKVILIQRDFAEILQIQKCLVRNNDFKHIYKK